MNSEHPTYPNPTIQEALCEIHFRLPDGVDWKPALLGELFKHIQSEFPDLEPAMQLGVRLQVGPSGAGQVFLPPQERMRYRHASRSLMLQLSKDTFTVNVLPKYPGWVRMSEDILNAWMQAREVIKPARVTRLGLRYINRIERTHPIQPPGHWLAPSDYIPKSVLSSLPGFLSRLETRTDQHNRLIVTLGEPTDSSGEKVNAIVLDIDCIVEKEIGIDSDAIMGEITVLHDFAWNIFSASMTPRLGRLLQGGER